MSDAPLVPALVASLGSALAPLGFVPRPGGAWVAAWTRKTFNTNRAVAVVMLPAGEDPVTWLGRERAGLATALGYVPFFYEVGMQIVLVGAPGARPIADAVQGINNQRYIVQSVFVVDPATRTVTAARTWGQVITGRFQDAVATAIAEVLGTATESGSAAAPPIPTPLWGRALPYVMGVVVISWVIRLFLE